LIESTADLRAALRDAGPARLLILGEGSNVILAPRLELCVGVMRTRGIESSVSGDTVEMTVAAGQNWHELVMWTLNEGYFGLENLALIPGSVGAAPVQNIGAYGVELSSRLRCVRVLELDSGRERSLDAAACGFGYRDSVFKRGELKAAILSVTLVLSRTPAVNLDYPELAAELGHPDPAAVDPRAVADAVMRVRRRKLPDPAVQPNVGSFFKNPVVPAARAEALLQRLPELKCFAAGDGVKLAAAQLLDLAGWKSRSSDAVQVWPSQPLVLVNRGRISGAAVLAFAGGIQRDIEQRYGVRLEVEPDAIGFPGRGFPNL